ncbi:MAG: site-specific integrase [Pirellulaceae bacterium]|nr:site-specific integrase [Pirellulaceae bacterium]
MKRLRLRYGDYQVTDFRPLALKEFIKSMVDDDCSRTYINMGIGKVKQMFRWGVSEELLDEAVLRRLQSVGGEMAGSSDARETEPVEPVSDSAVEATLPHMPDMVRAMVKLQRLTGMRPGEVCNMRECDLEQLPDGMMLYRPYRHKTKHKGKKRLIIIGPKARMVVAPYLGNGDQFVFSPQRSIVIEMAKRGIERRAPVTAGDQYTNDSYRRAINRACELAYPAPKNAGVDAKKDWRRKHNWSPNQLRHSLATEVRETEQSLESVAAVLGHANVSTSEIYAERNMKLAIQTMKKIG